MLSGKAPGWLAGKGWSSPQSSGITILSCLTAERQARIPLGRQPLLLMEPSSLAETAGTSSTRERSILLASGQLLQQSVLGLNPWPDTTLSSRFFGFLYSCLPSTAVFFCYIFLTSVSSTLLLFSLTCLSRHCLEGLLACTSSTRKPVSPSW